MRAIVMSSRGGPDVLNIMELADPVPTDGEVLIRVKAFGLNHAETYMRSGVWEFPPAVTGIECAGVVEVDRTGTMAAGTSVVAIMGGMGRTRNGSYAELVTVPVSNVVPIKTTLSWTDLVAVPEAYASAWAGLHQNLDLRAGQTVLVRGATSSLGQAAVNIAADDGATVVATTRNPAREALLRDLGADEVIIDDGKLAQQVAERRITADGVLDLVGNSVLRDSLQAVRPAGRVCQVGFLGGLDPVEDFNPIADMPGGVQFSFFGSFYLGAEGYPLAAIPVAEMVAKAEAGTYKAKPVRVFAFADIVEAHRVMESGQAGGKMVVAVD
jgi:NADPH:quinone reductase-like Zn-dependent oxidoreductase